MRSSTTLLAAALVLAACAADAPGTDSPELPVDSLSVDLVIGGHDAAPEYEFGRVSGLVGLDDGGVLVVDGVNHVVRVYGADGVHRFSFGRSGAGPGELQRPCCPAVDAGGRVWIRDGGNARYSIHRLGAGGAEYSGQVRMAHGDVNRTARVTFDAAGRVIDVGARAEPTGRRTWRHHLAEDGSIVVEHALHEVPEDSTGVRKVEKPLPNGYETRFVYPPYSPSSLFAASPTGEYAHALSSRYAIDWRTEDGTLVRHITLPLERGPALSERERTAAEARITRDAEWIGVARGSLGFSAPAHKQPLRRLHFDRGGNLWVELSVEDGASRRAHVHARAGGLERMVVWPGHVELIDGDISGDIVWGVAYDSLDVATVVRLRPAGPR